MKEKQQEYMLAARLANIANTWSKQSALPYQKFLRMNELYREKYDE
jgi:hypothetical protein